MRIAFLAMCVFVLASVASAAAPAETKYVADDAKALALKAAELIQSTGLDAARVAFHQDGEFKHDELYVNVINTAGIWLVYPPMPSGEGRSVLDIQDANGKFIVREIIKVAEQGEGWVDYRWLNPVTKQVRTKMSYAKRVSGTDMIVYVGIYQ